jgi:hypothetical protein
MIKLRCSICTLPPEKRDAIDEALSSGTITLIEVAASSGISKSALQRHSKHLDPSAPEEPKAIKQKELAPILAPAQVTPAPQPDTAGTKVRLLERIEFLWNESLDGLALSKEPITVKKPDGTSLELPGDLRARAGFIREARSVLELQGEVTGDFIKGQPFAGNIQVQIVMPASDNRPQPDSGFDFVEIAVAR